MASRKSDEVLRAEEPHRQYTSLVEAKLRLARAQLAVARAKLAVIDQERVVEQVGLPDYLHWGDGRVGRVPYIIDGREVNGETLP